MLIHTLNIHKQADVSASYHHLSTGQLCVPLLHIIVSLVRGSSLHSNTPAFMKYLSFYLTCTLTCCLCFCACPSDRRERRRAHSAVSSTGEQPGAAAGMGGCSHRASPYQTIQVSSIVVSFCFLSRVLYIFPVSLLPLLILVSSIFLTNMLVLTHLAC